MQALLGFLDSSSFMPHGHCFLWQPNILWLHVISDAGIAAAYFSIPFALAYFVRRRRDLPFPITFLLFGAFILLCGTTHLMSIWVLWHPDYAIEGLVKALTAIVSIATFIVMVRLIPKALLLTSSSELARLNDDLLQANTSLEELYAHRRASDQVRLRLVVDNVVDGIITFGSDGIIESVNPACERIFGYEGVSAVGKEITELLPVSRYEQIQEYLGSIPAEIEKSHHGTLETEGRRRDNSIFPLELSVRSFQIDGLTHFSAIARDITQRKQADEVRGLLASIVDSSRDVIISNDLGGIVISWNRAAEQLFGYTAAEAIGRHITFIIPPDRLAEDEYILGEIKAGETVESFETTRVQKDGSLVEVSLTVSPIRDAARKIRGASKIIRDISELREAEKTREQLRHVQKMEALGQLTGGIAHDFNNLLAIILGNLDFMAERTGVDDPLRTFITPSIEAAEHGAELTKQLLAFGRKQALQPRLISVHDMLRGFSAMVRPTLGERIETILALKDDVWTVNVDPSQLQSALLNLAVNARDAMPDGGKLILETQNVVLDEDYSKTNADVIAGDYVEIAVSDTGEGMTQEVMDKAFEPFFTTKEVGKGSGLGLSMVYGFVKQSRGHIKLYSEIGHGTSTKIYLPRAEGTPREAGDLPQDVAPIGDKSTIVLVVEDNKSVLAITSTMVESLGYRILKAETGDEAIKILEARSDIGFLLTDVMLPGAINGPALARRALVLYPKMKVLFNSGYAEQAIMQSGMLEEGVNLISKPFRKQQLAIKMNEIWKQP